MDDSIKFESIEQIKELYKKNNFVYTFLGSSKHKIKKKAEQRACEIIINKLNE